MTEGDEKIVGELFGSIASARSRMQTRSFGEKAV